MPHCQKEFAKPPVSSKDKKAKQAAKREADKLKAAKQAKREQEEAEAEAQARKEEEEKDPAEREAELARAREAARKEAEAQRLKDAKAKGGAAFKVGEWDEALACYSECIKLDPSDHIHWSNRAAVHKHLENYEEMLADATKCTELSPEFAKGWARIGAAYTGMDRLDEAEEAFQHGLTLEPENVMCLDGLKDIQKRREPSEEDKLNALVKELQGLEISDLHARALEEGLEESKLDEAETSKDQKGAMISLITAHKYLVGLIMEELQGLEIKQLRARASEEGLPEEKIEEAANAEDPEVALTELIVKYLSNELADAMIEVEADQEYKFEDSDDEEAEDDQFDFEVVTLDESELQLGAGDVFVAGAYIDDKHGELVLPNGNRLGNRSLKMYYKQRVRPTNDRQMELVRGRLNGLHAAVARREAGRLLARNAKVGLKSALASQPGRSRQLDKPDNKAMRAIVHHWGGGGGGSHYHLAGGKQYNKGNKVKGVVLRHSRQGAKLQAARNKANRGNASVSCLQ